jgi:hypothetical protein
MNERVYQLLAPTRLEDVQGQDKAVAAIQAIAMALAAETTA